MDSSLEPDDGDATVTAGFDEETFRLRSYQAEMLEQSLQDNIIVAMDTGSGKTHIALARTAAELEICDPKKLIWFLAPTVTLCEQQFAVFKSNLPGYGIQLLSGRDDVDHWTDQSVWNAVFHNVRIIVSTHQVLLDALTHAFVRMGQLALIIFDEAHHCIANHPANRIMQNFYKPLVQKDAGFKLPRILGLSASPVMGAKATGSDLQKIEENMSAIAKTPKIHRSELLRFVHRPQLLRVEYPAAEPSFSTLLTALRMEVHTYDLNSDPYVADLWAKHLNGHDTARRIEEVMMSANTYCYQQLKSLLAKGYAMSEELGVGPAEWYLYQCVSRFDEMLRTSNDHLYEWSAEEKQHLSKILKRLPLPDIGRIFSIPLDNLSPKVERLIKLLEAEASPDFTGIIFIEQRVWVTALAEIVSTHPRTKDLFKIGTFVGTSQSTKRKVNIANFAEPRYQEETLDHFRAGKKNLILATNVLEEGIDVSSCHLVICFEPPKTLKSFVQRRGRARKKESKYFVFRLESGNVRSPETWEHLEEQMKAAYLNDLRQVKEAERRELLEENSDRLYQVPSTGALLTLDNASQHLHHFCSILGSGRYVDPRPQFEFEETPNGRINARVTLPISVDPSVRIAKSLESWRTERMARKDAAFEAYKVLHIAGLVNDNLLPSREEVNDQAAEFQIPDTTPSRVEVSLPLDPWHAVAMHQKHNPLFYHRTLLILEGLTEKPTQMVILTPCKMPLVPEILLHWNESKRLFVKTLDLADTFLTAEEMVTIRAITREVLLPFFHGRMQEERYDFLWFLIPSDESEALWSHDRLALWHGKTSGSRSAAQLILEGSHDVSQWGLVSVEGDQRKFIPQEIVTEHHEPANTDRAQIKAIRAPKRRDFLHQWANSKRENEAYTKVEELSASSCLVDMVPASYCIFTLLFPSILARLEVYMIVDTLRTTLLAPLDIQPSDLPLVVTALTSSGTGEAENYQRLEFLGDCILKYIASVHLMAEHLTWPESFLTGKKGKVVCNGFLARATISAGLNQFIISKRVTGSKSATGAKWAPRYAGDVLSVRPQEGKTMCSSKLLADVIESLIGASYILGGIPKAFTCVRTLLPLENWTPLPDAQATLFEAVSADSEIAIPTALESLVGYKFHKRMLLTEALTHASYTGPNANCSYERLEFLGDAVLDYIITKRLYAHKPDLSHQKMHAMRTAMVNASFLAFRMFETIVTEERTIPPTMHKERHQRCLYQFLRYSSHQLVSSRDAAVMQHEAARDQILEALEQDNRFPWHHLALTDSPKFLSDIVESTIGAIYIDSRGDIGSCEAFVRRLGILGCLERILRDNVDCLHPKERLGHMAVDKDVKYVNVTDLQETRSGTEQKGYRVQVKVGRENVGGVVEGLKKLNAETIAAWKAARIMEGTDDVEMESEDEWFDAEGDGVTLDV